jgi:hypothetical protein
MSEFNRLARGQTPPSRVSFSRGLLKYVDEEPVVGRPIGAMATPLYTSTPNEGGVSRDEWWVEKMERMEKQHREEVEWQNLEQLLDGERRMVDTLSQFANMPWEYKKA